MTVLIVILVLLALTGFVYVRQFNAMRTAETRIEEAWSGIVVQLTRRHDLVPNLIAAVEGAMRHEEGIVDRLVAARELAIKALKDGTPQGIAEAEVVLGDRMQGLMVQVEDNPEIAATANIEVLQRQLEETEDQIAAARRLFNGNVQVLNQHVVTFPGNLIAPVHHIEERSPFDLPQSRRTAVQEVPRVAFNTQTTP
ncbi:LemA family protein [Acuticoccus sp. MNP-M23]|uniref:LemA family protein n=1 Tax=Acuticoccus sp. MNP-M23 TaxID=3072793 RepID=UPI0028161F82|nr:LemA family protein [Acuticoccus sp. MNP-M23]WMS41952.1 LemA family protein [Acuticoccus sp. MNP-M23]